MKISISLNQGRTMGCPDRMQVARTVKQAGFDGIDLDMCLSPSLPDTAEKLTEHVLSQANAAKAAGLEISQCHLPYWPGHIDAPGDGSCGSFARCMLPLYQKALALCGRIGCKTAVMHPYVSFESRTGAVEGNVRILKQLLPEMERLGVAVALENIYSSRNNHYLNNPVSDPEVILEIIRRVDSPLVGACIDTGHANICGYRMEEMAKVYGSHLIALHVNGNAGKDEHVIPYTMSDWCEQMDYYAFGKALKEIGYQGPFNLEVAVGPLPASVVQPYYNYAAAVARALSEAAR